MTEISFTKVNLPYGWLGNMSAWNVEFAGVTWRTTEALFQALRFAPDDIARREIQEAKSPMHAKMIAKKRNARFAIVPRSEADVSNMRLVLHLKAEQHALIRERLAETGDATIIEDCSARSNESGLFWGMSKRTTHRWVGQNQLGKLWMELRAQL